MISMTLPQYHRHECTVDGLVVHLTGQWNEVLAILMVSPPDRFVCQTTFIEALWPNPDFEPDYAADIICRAIFELRRRGVPIEMAYHFGYCIPRWAREARPMDLAA